MSDGAAFAACVAGRVVFATASRISNAVIAGAPVPEPVVPTPNQVAVDTPVLKVVLWETNWNPNTLATTDNSSTVYVNALHVTIPSTSAAARQHVIIAHAEASATCARTATALPLAAPAAATTTRVDTTAAHGTERATGVLPHTGGLRYVGAGATLFGLGRAVRSARRRTR